MPRRIEVRFIEEAEDKTVLVERVVKSTADSAFKWRTLLDAAARIGQKTAAMLDAEDKEADNR